MFYLVGILFYVKLRVIVLIPTAPIITDTDKPSMQDAREPSNLRPSVFAYMVVIFKERSIPTIEYIQSSVSNDFLFSIFWPATLFSSLRRIFSPMGVF